MLSKLSVRKPYTIVVAVIMVLILGTISFMNLQTDLLPSIDLPYVVVVTNYPGASPEEIEMVVTKPIEQIVATINNIKNVRSISRENSSVVILEFNNDVNMDSAIIEVNGNLDLIKGVWPDSISSPMVIRLNPDMLPIMISSIDVEGMNDAEISKFVSEKVIPELESINGVASVSGIGLLEEQIEVVISPEKIETMNKNILKKVDSKLSEAEDKLIEAKKDIQEGRVKLNTESNSQLDKLKQGDQAISMGKEQIAIAEDAITQGLDELNKNKTNLENILNEINKGELELTIASRLLSFNEANLSPENKLKLEDLKQSLVAVKEKKVETNAGLDFIVSKISEIEKEKLIIDEKKLELDNQAEQIKSGKLLLTTEVNKAKAKLTDGEKTINDNLDKLQDSKEEAFKKATLDGVISTKMVSGILAAQNFSMPAGYITDEGNDYLVKVGNKIEDIDEIKELLIFDTGEEAVGKIYLNDVADIKYIDNSEDIYAKVNGNNAVILTFQKQSNFPTAEVSNNIKARFDKLRAENEDLSITALMDQGVYIDIVVKSVLNNIIYGGILAILILIFFLKDLKPTFIIAVSIPISIIFAIAMMYFTGVTINIISLAGLALGVGMLVDNSIVVIENIYRLRNEGLSASKAAIEGAKEVSGALLASTLTTAAVFLPIVFTKGISRQLFEDMGLTIAYSLFASLLVALTLVPAMGASMLKNTKEKDHKLFDKFINGYESALRWTLKYKIVVMTFVVVLLVISSYLVISIGTSFIPTMEAPQMSMSIEMPLESTPEDAIKMTDQVIERIVDIEGIETIGAFNSGGMGMGMGGMGPNNSGGSMSLYLLLDENKETSNSLIENEIRRRTEDLDAKISISTSNMDMTALGGSGLEILVKGRDLDTLRDIAKDVSNILNDTSGTTEVSSGLDKTSTEIRIVVDKEKAMDKGLTVAQVFSNINTAISKGKAATTINSSNKDYPVIVIDGKNQAISKKDLEELEISVVKDGEELNVKVGDIVSISEEQGLSSISRNSQERYIAVTANIDEDYNIGLVSKDFEAKLKNYNIPDGYRVDISGETELINNTLKDLTYMLLLAIAFIYLIMVAQFQSLLSPFIVMFTIPLAFTGGLLALIITGYDLSVISMLGFLVLSGVVVNNGIVFVDFTNQLRDKGIDKTEALVSAGKTRMRPILMTAITTILGLSTLSVGVGIGAEMLQPLAIVAIGGLTYATILTLFVVPAMYDLFHKNKTRRSFIEEDEL